MTLARATASLPLEIAHRGLDGTVLYADLDDSTKLVDTQAPWFAAEVYNRHSPSGSKTRLVRSTFDILPWSTFGRTRSKGALSADGLEGRYHHRLRKQGLDLERGGPVGHRLDRRCALA